MPYVSSREVGPKEVFLSIAHVCVTLIFLFLLNLGIAWILNNVLFHLFEWFNHLSLFWKLMLLALGGFAIVQIVIGLSSLIAGFIGMLLYSKLPDNNFTTTTTIILAIIGCAWTMYDLWSLPIHYDFWVVLEMLLASGFIISLYNMVVMVTQKKTSD